MEKRKEGTDDRSVTLLFPAEGKTPLTNVYTENRHGCNIIFSFTVSPGICSGNTTTIFFLFFSSSASTTLLLLNRTIVAPPPQTQPPFSASLAAAARTFRYVSSCRRGTCRDLQGIIIFSTTLFSTHSCDVVLVTLKRQ